MPTLQEDLQTTKSQDVPLPPEPEIDYSNPESFKAEILRLNQEIVKSKADLSYAMTEGAKETDRQFEIKKNEAVQESHRLSEAYLKPTPTTPQQILGDLIRLAGILTFQGNPGLGTGLSFLGKTIKGADPAYQEGQKREKFGANLLDQNTALATSILNNAGASGRQAHESTIRAIEGVLGSQLNAQTNLANIASTVGMKQTLMDIELGQKRQSAEIGIGLAIQRLKNKIADDQLDSTEIEEVNKAIEQEFETLRAEVKSDPSTGGIEGFTRRVYEALGVDQNQEPKPGVFEGINKGLDTAGEQFFNLLFKNKKLDFQKQENEKFLKSLKEKTSTKTKSGSPNRAEFILKKDRK
jgi:hypothetical protein